MMATGNPHQDQDSMMNVAVNQLRSVSYEIALITWWSVAQVCWPSRLNKPMPSMHVVPLGNPLQTRSVRCTILTIGFTQTSPLGRVNLFINKMVVLQVSKETFKSKALPTPLR